MKDIDKHKLQYRALEILDTAQEEKRELTQAEKAECTSILDQLEGSLHDELNARLSEPAYGSSDIGREVANEMMGGASSATTGKEYRSYRAMFPNAPQSKEGFKDMREFVRVLTSGRFDPRLEARVMVEGFPGLGGFAVPTPLLEQIWDGGLESEIMRPRANVYPMESETKRIPAWDGSNHTASLYGGLTGTWIAENSTATPVDAELRQMTLTAKKLVVYVNVSREQMADAPNFRESIETAMIKALGFYLDEAFLAGTGAGQPLGVVNAGSTITEATEVGQAIDTVVFENVAKMWSRLLPVCQQRAIWVANPGCIPSLYRMSLAVGTGGAPVFLPQGGISSQPYATLFGRPLLYSEKLPALGDLGDIMVFDPSMYAIGLRQEVSLDMTNAIGWYEDYISLRVVLRADGQPLLDSSITPMHGTAQSWAVMLAAR